MATKREKLTYLAAGAALALSVQFAVSSRDAHAVYANTDQYYVIATNGTADQLQKALNAAVYNGNWDYVGSVGSLVVMKR